MIRAAIPSTSRVVAATTFRPSLRASQLKATQQQQRWASGGGEQYNEPSGYLFGEKPPKPGQKREKEDWENIWYYGFFGVMALTAVGQYFRPDTSITTWAAGEARKNLEASGKVWKYEPSPYSGIAKKEE